MRLAGPVLVRPGPRFGGRRAGHRWAVATVGFHAWREQLSVSALLAAGASLAAGERLELQVGAYGYRWLRAQPPRAALSP